MTDMIELSNKDKALLTYLKTQYDIEEDSPVYKASFLLLQRLWQGSICISFNELKKEIHELEKPHLTKSKASGKTNEARPLIFDGENLYIQKYYIYQSIIIEKIDKLHKNDKFHIITGGPGTGKTTLLSEILKDKLSDKKILLAAPTGKAAYRMTESLSAKGITLQAQTIHRLLGSIHLSVNFRRNKDYPLDADIIAIDECSMIDVSLMAKLMDAIPDSCHLYLLGDKNQLSPIEAGTVFSDICNKYKDCKEDVYNERKENFRAKEAPGIVELSEKILNNTIDNFNNDNINHFDNFAVNKIITHYKNLFNSDTPEQAINTLKDFQILCAVKNGRNGTININKELIKYAAKEKAKFTPIIITENNYVQNLFNGDVGVKDKENAYFIIDNTIKQYPLFTLPGYDDAFAITIHKSQGSEYTKIAVVYPETAVIEDGEESIFTRELLYTAVTRARKECLIFGSKELLLKSCEKKVYRASGIK